MGQRMSTHLLRKTLKKLPETCTSTIITLFLLLIALSLSFCDMSSARYETGVVVIAAGGSVSLVQEATVSYVCAYTPKKHTKKTPKKHIDFSNFLKNSKNSIKTCGSTR